MPNTHRLAHGFDIVSGFYDMVVHLFFGTKIDTFQAKALRQIPPCDEAIIVGGGTGRILKAALNMKLAKRYHYVDVSKKMQEKTKARLTADELERVTFYSEIEELETKADIAILPFVLDCYTDHDALKIINSISKGLRTSGSMIIIDFAESSKWLHRAFIFMLYRFFRVVAGLETSQLPNYYRVFDGAGYYLTQKETMAHGWIFAAEFSKNQKNAKRIENNKAFKTKNVI